MKVYISYEEGSKGRFTLEEMKSLYKKTVDKTEYQTFDIWLLDMLKSGVFMEKNEPYHYFKSAKKTAEKNGLVYVDGNGLTEQKLLFDFTYLDSLDIPNREKDIIKEEAKKNCSIVNRTAYVISFPDKYTLLSAFIDFVYQKVYDTKTYNRLFVILKAVRVKYAHGERNSMYEQYYSNNRVEFDVRNNLTLVEEVEI